MITVLRLWRALHLGPAQGRLELSQAFEEAATAFGDPLALFIQDGAHEDRMLIVGLTSQQRLMVVVHEEAGIR